MILKTISHNKIFLYFVILLFFIANFLFFETNESSILATARHFVDPEWIKNDWWLSTGIEYGNLFNFFSGNLYKLTSYQFTFFSGRLLVYGIWAFLFLKIFEGLKLDPIFYPILICVIQKFQSMGFGEGPYAGFETKTFAYLSFFYFFILIFQKRHLWASFFLGLSLSFHILVGFYLAISFFIFLFFHWLFLEKKILEKELFKKTFPQSLALYILGSSFGLYAFFKWKFLNLNTPADLLRLGSEIYVTKRVPHHVMFNPYPEFVFYLFFFCLFLYLRITKKSFFKESNLFFDALMGITAATFLFFTIGFFLTFFEKLSFLKFYFFRTSDALVPLVVILSFFKMFQFLLSKINNKKVLYFVSFFVLFLSIPRSIYKTNRGLRIFSKFMEEKKDPAYLWIKNNTNSRDQFITSPTNQSFYIFAERPIWVAFKHSPQKEIHLVEWFRRLTLLNGNIPPTSYSFHLALEIERNMNLLSGEYYKKMGQENNLRYLFVKKPASFNLPLSFEGNAFRVYSLF